MRNNYGRQGEHSMQELKTIQQPLVTLFARLAAIGRALRNPKTTTDLGELAGQPQVGGGDPAPTTEQSMDKV
jgi:hypothetical protein